MRVPHGGCRACGMENRCDGGVTEMMKNLPELLAPAGSIDALCAAKGEGRGMREARKHVAWYMHGLRGAAEFRRMAGELTVPADLDRLLERVYIENRDEPQAP